MNISPDDLKNILLHSSIPGACGGVALFLFSLKKGHYKNNKYMRKLTIEVLGGFTLASFLGPIFPDEGIVLASFLVGLTWVGIIQVARSKITKIVKATIGEKIS